MNSVVKKWFLIAGGLASLMVMIGTVSQTPVVLAKTSGSDNVTFALSTSCTIGSSLMGERNIGTDNGQYEVNISDTKIITYCNDNNGYSIYVVGSGNDIDSDVDLASNVNSGFGIHGNTHDENSNSAWFMKVTSGGDMSANASINGVTMTKSPTVMNGYDNYSLVPSNYTLMASRPSGTNVANDATASESYLNATHTIYTSSTQYPDTHTGKVKYVVMHQ